MKPTIVPAATTTTIATQAAVLPLATPRASISSSPPESRGITPVMPTSTLYTDPQGRFSFTVPDGYQQTPVPPQQPTVAARFESRLVSGVILVTIQPMEPGATLDLKTEVTQKASSKLPEYQALTTQPTATTVAGQSARQFEFLLTENGGRRYHALVITTVRGDAFSTLTIQSEEKDFTAHLAQARVFPDTFAFLVA